MGARWGARSTTRQRSEGMALSREEAAEKLGMKPSEIGGIDGNRVTTHDGTVTEIDGDKLTTRERTDADAKEPGEVVGVAEATPDGPQVVDSGDGNSASVAQAMAYAPGREVRADTPPRDPRLDGEVPGAFDDTNGLEGVDERDEDQAAENQGGDADEVPDGPIDEVLVWVDGDKDRARRAREHEQKRERPRRGLLAQLAEMENRKG